MSRMAIGSIAIVLLATLQCEPQETKVGPLTNLRQTSILVESLNEATKALGLSKVSLESQLLVGLRRDIPRLAVRESARPALYLMVNVSGETTKVRGRVRAFSACVTLQMWRPVTILEDVGVGEVTLTRATVWHRDYLLGGPRRSMRRRVKDEIDEQLTEFAADYYRQNPQ